MQFFFFIIAYNGLYMYCLAFSKNKLLINRSDNIKPFIEKTAKYYIYVVCAQHEHVHILL
jgi:hypothetical protein